MIQVTPNIRIEAGKGWYRCSVADLKALPQVSRMYPDGVKDSNGNKIDYSNDAQMVTVRALHKPDVFIVYKTDESGRYIPEKTVFETEAAAKEYVNDHLLQ
ncbi:MAG: hypothetical protein EA420_03400 [Candidatus Competibacteraceae bacterium]|nr:MAG: hypothetical protein EA420_03400 [Candidatus Competibacteraceae bacterium]